jgi:hypothetical protein
MLPSFRALRFLFLSIFAYGIHLSAQDMTVRVEAIRLLEHATAVSPEISPGIKQNAE